MMGTEQQVNLNFFFWKNSLTEALKLLQEVFGDDMMSRTLFIDLHWRFKEGKKNVEDDPRCGRPSTSRTDKNVE